MDLLEACCRSRVLWEQVSRCLDKAILIVDFDGRILFASPVVESTLGYLPEELAEREFSVLFTVEDLDYLYPNLLYLVQSFSVFEDELMLTRKDGTRFIAQMIIRTCSDPSLNCHVAIVSIQDIDRQKQLERFLEQSHHEDFVKVANGIAHEIRNPLVGIGGFVRRLCKICESPGGHHDRYYGYIMDNLHKIESLVKKIEFFARLPVPHFSQVSLEDLVGELLALYGKKAEEREVTLTTDIQDQILLLDRALIARVLSILVENALEAIAGPGRICIFSEVVKENECVLSVMDTGRGIPPKDLPHIFNPFFSTKPQGAGMDLAIARRIMKSHQGSITVQSNGGEGATFALHLPLERRRKIRTCLMNEE